MPSTQLEIEAKLDAAPDIRLPDLSSLPGVARVEPAGVEELEATYFDSAELRLIRNRTTLRRRTGGHDAGWHLKLPASDALKKDARTEVHRPLGSSPRDVPEQLLDLVRVRLRGEPVEPVARITTRRTLTHLLGADGTLLARVAEDDVAAEALGEQATESAWREIEVELAEGDRDLLDAAVDAIVAAGAETSGSASKVARALQGRLGPAGGLPVAPEGRPAEAKPRQRPASDVVLDHLREQVAALQAQDPQVRLDTDDAVHQLRVAARRLRSALATFKRMFEPGSVDPLRSELKWLGQVFGAARDAEVQREELREAVAAQPAELVLGPVLRRIELELQRQYRTAHAAVVETLDGDRYLALLDALDRFVTEPPLSDRASRAAGKELPKAVRRSVRRVRLAVERAGGHPSRSAEHDLELHEVRKAAKRARYAGEAVRPVFGKRAERLASAAEEVQELLGDHQDTVVLRVRLRSLAVQAHLAGENGFTFGRLHALAEKRAALDEYEFERAWRTLRRRADKWPG